jgi:cytoskeletal protein CcmA (bactofilin family)
MALVIDDRVKETSTTTGTGTLNLSGAVSGFQTFVAGVGNGNTTYYAIVNRDEAEWETGIGTVTDASTDTLARTTVIASSNSDSAVDFSAGTKDVFTTLPASKAVYEDASNDVTLANDLILGSDSAVLKFGADSDTTLTHTDGTGLTLNSTNKLLFRDSALYINSSTDGQLDLVADTEIQIAATTIDINGAVALDGAITGATNITLSGELDAATLDISGNADIDGTANLDNTDIDGTLAVDGTTISLDATTSLNIDNSNTSNGITIGTATSGVPISIGHTTSEVTINDNLTVTGTLTLGSNAELTEAELEFLDGITAGTAAASKAMVADANIDITGGRNITISGELDAATLDISGNADIDGTTNLDAVDIDGAVQLDATFTVGADDQGYDVKLFGDTASAYMLWDTSADDLILGGAAGLVVPDSQLTLGSTAVTATAAELNLIDGGTSRGTTALADGDGILINDGGTMRMTNVTAVKTYMTGTSATQGFAIAMSVAL